MKPGTLEIKAIFGTDRRLLVPLFQRPYVWRRELQWEPLWDDVRKLAERNLAEQAFRPHFLGAIVLDQVRNPAGTLETRFIIDGQQRLTTLQLLLEAFADLSASLEQPNHYKSLLKLTRNDDPMSTDPDEVFKVWPTNVDREAFRRVMNCESPEELRESFGVEPGTDEVGHPIADGYLFFYRSIADWLRADDSTFQARLDALLAAMRGGIRMVTIDLEDDDDAQLIFETLNARGTPLLPSDLVKNWLFHRAEIRGFDTEALYRDFWQSFDENGKYWRQEIGVGHAARARIDLFLQHYLTLKKRDEIPVAHLYKAYCDYATAEGNGDPCQHFSELKEYSETYRGFDFATPGTREATFFRRLGALDITAAYPFVLELSSRYLKQKRIHAQVLIYLESFLVRRMICQLNTRGYNYFFIDLLATLDGSAEGLANRVQEALASGEAESNRWPRDAEFRSNWTSQPVFRRLVRRRVRMLLEALEDGMKTDMTEILQLDEKLTIEHLLPQKWSKHWPLSDDEEPARARETREAEVHTIGNLTLLRRKLNSTISNGPWRAKLKDILDHSALNLNRPLAAWDGWDEGAIRTRSEELFAVARKIWPGPSGRE